MTCDEEDLFEQFDRVYNDAIAQLRAFAPRLAAAGLRYSARHVTKVLRDMDRFHHYISHRKEELKNKGGSK